MSGVNEIKEKVLAICDKYAAETKDELMAFGYSEEDAEIMAKALIGAWAHRMIAAHNAD